MKKRASVSIVNASFNVFEDKKIGQLKIYAVLTIGFLIIVIGGWWILHRTSRGSAERFSIYLLDTNVGWVKFNPKTHTQLVTKEKRGDDT